MVSVTAISTGQSTAWRTQHLQSYRLPSSYLAIVLLVWDWMSTILVSLVLLALSIQAEMSLMTGLGGIVQVVLENI
jgi:hypothetical protein